MKGARGALQHFGKLQLPRMKIEPAQMVGHHIGGQDADGELMPLAQPLGQRAVKIAARQPQFVGQRLGLSVEIGEMIAPALDLAPDHHDRHRLGRRGSRTAAALDHPVEGAGERLHPARRGGEPFLHLRAVERKISEQRIGKPAPQPLHAAARRIPAELARVHVEPLGQPQHQRGGERPLVLLYKVEIAGRDIERIGQRHLRHAGGPPQPPHRMPRQYLLLGHLAPSVCKLVYRFTLGYA